ncbi:MAG: hypothetical protein FD164_2399, partial [Nitrospirae bacterium]
MGIVGGSFGIANRGDNTFDLLRHYPETQSDEASLAVFPYLPGRACNLLELTDASVSERMHGLFSIQRDKQRLEPSSSSPAAKQPLKVPEFFRHLSGSTVNDKQYILVDDKEIRETLAKWLYIWHCAASSDIGLAATVATARLSEPALP